MSAVKGARPVSPVMIEVSINKNTKQIQLQNDNKYKKHRITYKYEYNLEVGTWAGKARSFYRIGCA